MKSLKQKNKHYIKDIFYINKFKIGDYVVLIKNVDDLKKYKIYKIKNTFLYYIYVDDNNRRIFSDYSNFISLNEYRIRKIKKLYDKK